MAVHTLCLNIIDLETHHQNPVAHVPIYIMHSGHTSILTCMFIHHRHIVRAFVYMILLDANVCLNVHTPGRA